MKWKKEKQVRFTLRLPESIYKKVKKLIKKECLEPSLNEMIVRLLVYHFK